jgi:hypothetical protein
MNSNQIEDISTLLNINLNNNIVIYIIMMNELLNDIKHNLYINNARKQKILVAQRKFQNLSKRLKHFEILDHIIKHDNLNILDHFETYKNNFDVILNYDASYNKNEEPGKYWRKNDYKYWNEASKKYWCSGWT